MSDRKNIRFIDRVFQRIHNMTQSDFIIMVLTIMHGISGALLCAAITLVFTPEITNTGFQICRKSDDIVIIPASAPRTF